MNAETISKSRIGRLFIKALAAAMESQVRYRLFGPVPLLSSAALRPGQTVLEVGCGTGYFTIPAARLIGESGSLVAIDVVTEAVELVAAKVRAAGLQNVRVLKADALETGLDSAYFDTVLLFGVTPAPMLPIRRLLSEMHRVLKCRGRLAVWPVVPGWLPGAIIRSRLFRFTGKHNGVRNFERE